jgi:hypothetical protein
VDPREKAEQAAEALLAAAQVEREREAEASTRGLVRFYPALARIPPLERFAALREAREFASQHAVARFMRAVLALTVAVLVALILAGHAGVAKIPAWFIAGVAIASQLIHQVLVRRHFQGRQS